jgi:hypothetical protein
MESGTPVPSTPPNDRIPRGAIIVVVIGIIATIAAALLSGGGATSDLAYLEWVQEKPMPASKPVTIPGSKDAKMVLLPGKIQATGTNVAGYSLFRVLSTLRIEEGAPTGSGKVICTIHATAPGTLIGQSGEGGLRTTYPRSSEEGIYGQPVPESIVVRFASHGHEAAIVETADMPPRFATIEGVKLNWPKYQPGTEHIEYFLPEGKPKATVKLPFFTVWKTTKSPSAEVACELQVAAGKSMVETKASLPLSPPINEEAEEIKAQEREEAEEASGESEESESEGE